MKFHNIFFIKIISLLLIASCQKKSKVYYNEDLQGHWAIDMKSENLRLKKVVLDSGHNVYPHRHLFENVNNGFYFYRDSCVYKPGFVDIKNKNNGLPMLVNSKSAFRINGDTLKIWDDNKMKWRELLIEGLNKDTLVLKELNYDRFFRYNKVNKVSNGFENYNKIVVVAITPDYLSDEIYYLDKAGNYLYKKFDIRELDLSKSNFYQFKLKGSQLQTLIDNFDFVDINSLNDEYLSSKSGDNNAYFVFFINDDKVVKVIEDNDNVSPDELQWGYVPMMFLRRQVNMEIVESGKDCYACGEIKKLKFKIIENVKEGLEWDWNYINGSR